MTDYSAMRSFVSRCYDVGLKIIQKLGKKDKYLQNSPEV